MRADGDAGGVKLTKRVAVDQRRRGKEYGTGSSQRLGVMQTDGAKRYLDPQPAEERMSGWWTWSDRKGEGRAAVSRVCHQPKDMGKYF